MGHPTLRFLKLDVNPSFSHALYQFIDLVLESVEQIRSRLAVVNGEKAATETTVDVSLELALRCEKLFQLFCFRSIKPPHLFLMDTVLVN